MTVAFFMGRVATAVRCRGHHQLAPLHDGGGVQFRERRGASLNVTSTGYSPVMLRSPVDRFSRALYTASVLTFA